MTWHCERWTRNIDRGTVDEGQSAESLYNDYRCKSFYGSVTRYFNHEDEADEYGDTDEAMCSDHGQTARWREAPDLKEELKNDDFLECTECGDEWFTRERYLDEHNEQYHDEDDDDEAPAGPKITFPPPVPTLRSTWYSHTT